MSLGVPLKIMHEAVHHVVTVELKSGETFTGYMAEAEVHSIPIYLQGYNERSIG